MNIMTFKSYLVVAVAGIGLAGAASGALADSDEFFPPVDHTLTKEECSACHMAFSAAFLPARSWGKIMTTLDNHFGEDASLDQTAQNEIQAWLEANAADTGGNRRGVMRNVAGNETPMRITDMPWWKRKHRPGEVNPAAFDRPNVGTKANCTACHRGAERGYFEDD